MNRSSKPKTGRLGLLTSLYNLTRGQIKKRIAPITHVETNEPLIALTFDDGPDPIYTPILLKLLKEFQTLGTFFMVGESALKYPWLVDEVAAAGHEIGNHTMSHISVLSVGGRERRRQMRMCEEVLSPNKIRLFRPPYGEQNVWTNLDAVLQGYKVVGWDLNVGDWCNTDFSPMADELLKRITSGSVILFHDAIYDKGHPKHTVLDHESNLGRGLMIDLVRLLLNEYSGRFHFVTMTEMLKHGKAKRGSVLP